MVKFLWIAPMALSLIPLQAADPPVRRVLFVCTGNFFRSAFAEHYFNHLAAANRRLPADDPRRKAVAWVAESRGLDPAQLSSTQRAARMSQYTVARLRQLGIPVPTDPATRLPTHTPRRLVLSDLERCERVVAMHDASHRPMLRRLLARGGGRGPGPGSAAGSGDLLEHRRRHRHPGGPPHVPAAGGTVPGRGPGGGGQAIRGPVSGPGEPAGGSRRPRRPARPPAGPRSGTAPVPPVRRTASAPHGRPAPAPPGR